MKSLKTIFTVSLAALTLASCENFFDDKQIGNDYKPTDVRTIEYTLTADDYKSVTSNSKNQAAALALCTPEDSSAYTSFLQIAKDKAFNDIATADLYLPAFIYAKFPQLSMGSICNVTYDLMEGKPAYLTDFDNAKSYVLTTADYQLAWGSETDYVEYLTPATLSKLSDVLNAVAAETDSMYVVSYAYQEYEPVFGGGDEPEAPSYPTLLQMIADYNAGTIANGDEVTVAGYVVSMFLKPNNFNKYGSVSVWLNDTVGGTAKVFELFNCYGLNGDTLARYTTDVADPDPATNIDVTSVTDRSGNTFAVGNFVVAKGAITLYNTTYELKQGCYFTEKAVVPSASAPAMRMAAADNNRTAIYVRSSKWSEYKNDKVTATVLMEQDIEKAVRFLEINFPYADKDDKVVLVYNNKGYSAKEFIFNGITWVENQGIVTETLQFALTEEWLANMSVYYKQAIADEGQGKLVIQDVNLSEGITYVWTYSSSYGMKGTSYKSGAHVAESWVVTPAIRLKNSKKPALQFDQAINYGPDTFEARAEQMSVRVSTDYAGDVETATWKELPWNVFNEETSIGFPETNSWTFYNTGDMDLSEWNNQTIYIGFRYNAVKGATCATWEFKNLLVHEVEE